MKKIILLFLFLLFGQRIHSQMYLEQNSGVTTNLTSVSMSINYDYIVWACGYNGTVLSTTNYGTNWIHVINNGIPNTVNLVNIFCIDASTVLTAGYSGINTFLYRSSNNGGNWTQVFTQSNGYINAVWMRSATDGFMCGNPVGGRWSLWKTTNGGLNWDSTGLRLFTSTSETGWNNSLSLKGNNIMFGTNNSKIYFSSNSGLNWIARSTTPEINSSAVWIYRSDSTFAYFGGSNSYKTTNSGLNWSLLTCPGSGNFAGFVDGLLGTPFNSPPMLSFAVRNDSSIYYNMMGSNWNRVYSAPTGVYHHITVNLNYVGEYAWAVRSNGGITRLGLYWGGIKKISSEVPDKFSLMQNYPNPFNPTTKIKFDIPASPVPSKGGGQEINLKIYDILGKQVASLIPPLWGGQEGLSPGTYEVEWDASNYPSGVYFYQLKSESFSQTKRMVIIK